MTRWCWSLDQEEGFYGECSTATDAFFEALIESDLDPERVEPGTNVYLNEFREIAPSSMIPVSAIRRLVETAKEVAGDRTPEEEVDWLEHVSKEDLSVLRQGIAAVFDRWCKDRHPERFFDSMGSGQCRTVMEEDFLKIFGVEVLAEVQS